MSDAYSKAYVEVLEIISHFSEEELNKIPQEKINFYNEHKDNNYQFKIDPTIDLAEQNISREANAIIVSLFRNYFATEKQKQTLDNLLKQNEQKSEEEKRKKYNPDDIFKQDKKITPIENTSTETNNDLLPIEISEEKWYKKILDFFKSLFKK